MTEPRTLLSLTGRVALVTGASGYLGGDMARALGGAGATVLLNGRSEEKLQALASELRSEGLAVEPACFDVTDNDAVQRFSERLTASYGRLDILVNNAYDGSSGLLEQASREDYLRAYDLAVASAAQLLNACLPLLEKAVGETGTASVINIASMYGSVSPRFELYGELSPNPPIYGPAKAALIQWTRYLAAYLGPRSIRANSISPGAFPPPSVAAAHPEFVAALAGNAPLGRIGSPEDLQGAVMFLAGDGSRFVTGIDLPVDGGWTSR